MLIDELRDMFKKDTNLDEECVVAILSCMQHKEEARALEVKTGKKILVIGDVKFNEAQLCGFLKTLNISKKRVEFRPGYDRYKHQSIRSIQYSNKYALVLAGATPHSMKDMGAYSSLIAAMEAEEGWPKVVRLGNGLRGSFSSAKQAIIQNLKDGVIVAA